MKKIIISLLFIFSTVNLTFWFELERKEIVEINKTIRKIEKTANVLWFYYRDLVIAENEVILRNIVKDTKSYFLIEELNKRIKQIKFFDFAKNHAKENKIDLEKLKQNWLTWHNEARNNHKLKNNYIYDDRLDNTAFEWSYNNMEKWVMDHKRTENSDYYNYNEIESWFQERWVKCSVVNGITSSESLWYHSYYCKKNNIDCTSEAIKASKQIFDMFMAEKWLKYPLDAHYRAIVHKNLNYIWFWISIKKENHNYLTYKDYDYYKIYITTHYCTSIKK